MKNKKDLISQLHIKKENTEVEEDRIEVVVEAEAANDHRLHKKEDKGLIKRKVSIKKDK